MLDRRASQLIGPALVAVAKRLHAWGVGADSITCVGFGLGLAAWLAIVFGYFGPALGLLLISRLCDGIDGALARLTHATDSGGFLDICLDFLYYALIVLAFAVHNPETNALAAAVLLGSFIGTGSSFLAFAALAQKRHIAHELPNKSIYFLGGLTEATETLLVFAAMCIWPEHFAKLAYGFALLCVITTFTRIHWGYNRLKQP